MTTIKTKEKIKYKWEIRNYRLGWWSITVKPNRKNAKAQVFLICKSWSIAWQEYFEAPPYPRKDQNNENINA